MSALQGAPGARIRELVCGLPASKRGKRLILALRAFIDGSGNPDRSKALVLGGYISTAERWEAFSDRWQEVLDASPKIHRFVMKEAVKRKGPWHRLSDAERDARLRLFYEAIEDHVLTAVFCVVPFEAFFNALQVFPMKIGMTPYKYALLELMGRIRDRQAVDGVMERIDFVFDEERTQQDEILAAWPDVVGSARSLANPVPASRTPLFEDDEETLPLQAADLEAFMRRNGWESANFGSEFFQPSWAPRRMIPHFGLIANEKGMREMFERTLAKFPSVDPSTWKE